MKPHDILTRDQALGQWDELSAQYLALVPDADLDAIVFNTISNTGIANTEGITIANLSIFTRVEGIKAALAALPTEPILDIGFHLG